MPRKLRDLIADLTEAGFTMQSGRGSHRKFTHPKGQVVILSGHNTGVDAKHYWGVFTNFISPSQKPRGEDEKKHWAGVDLGGTGRWPASASVALAERSFSLPLD